MYHPNFFNQGCSHRQQVGERLQLLRQHFSGGTVLDIGCSEGYNTFGLADQAQHITAIDNVQERVELCRALAEEHSVDNVEFIHTDFRDYLNKSESRWDCVLYLSVHHHLVGELGLSAATAILKQVSDRCDSMLFDMGQKNEKGCQGYRWWKALPPARDQEKWLRDYLAFGRVELLGSFPIHGVQRMVFEVVPNSTTIIQHLLPHV